MTRQMRVQTAEEQVPQKRSHLSTLKSSNYNDPNTSYRTFFFLIISLYDIFKGMPLQTPEKRIHIHSILI